MQEKVKILVQLLVLPNSFVHYLNAYLISISPTGSQEFHKVHMKTPVTCVKSVQSFSWFVFSCIRTEYGASKSSYLDTFHAVCVKVSFLIELQTQDLNFY